MFAIVTREYRGKRGGGDRTFP